MCGIAGVFKSKNAKEKVETALKAISYRGRDNTGIFCSGNHCIGHLLHAIVSSVKQPIKNKFVSNCEIYNWKELAEKEGIKAENDAELILELIEKKGINAIEKFDGVFAFALWEKNKVIVARDILGEKPVWFSHNEEFAFASEKKALEAIGYIDIEELNPRKILVYDINENSVSFIEREFFKTSPEIKVNIKELKEKIFSAVQKRIPEKKLGLLFSGGIDSTIIAFILKKMGVDFVCYTAGLEEKGMKPAEDIEWAQKAAKHFGFKLKVIKIPLSKVEKYIKKIVPLIEDSNVVKVGVALPFFLACEEAKKDNVKVIFSGLGSEEIFAGYERHEKSSNINEECVFGLKQMYQRDLYRDDVVTMFHTIELRTPFLDTDLIKYALRIPAEYKIKDGVKKLILREAALEMGVDKEFAFRKKTAAQYGSRFDKALEKLAKKEGKTKSEYLKKFYPSHNLRLGVLFSSGKDSAYSAYIMKRMNYGINCLITIKSKNPDSYMFHTPNIKLTELQAESMNIPLFTAETAGKKEEELIDLENALKEAKKKYNLDGIVTGALFSSYQRNRIETICDKLSLKCFSPLWHKNQEDEMRELIKNGFEFIFSSVAADGLSRKWLGKTVTSDDVEELIRISRKTGFNAAGEGGEFESFVTDCPLFKKRIRITDSETVMENENTGRFIIKKAVLEEKG